MAQVNKQAIAAAFGRAATHYEQHAGLQRQSADALLALLPERAFPRVLDAGSGPGRMSRYWRERGSAVTALDLSPQMLDVARSQNAAHQYIAGDIESLPLADARVDLAWSNLAVQWCGDLQRALSELYRVVRPGGVVAFTTLAQGSLPELCQAWRAAACQPLLSRSPHPGSRRHMARAIPDADDHAVVPRCAERNAFAERHRRDPSA